MGSFRSSGKSPLRIRSNTKDKNYSFSLQVDNLQFFIDSEIAKKEEKDRIIHDRQVSSVMAAKKTKSWDDELRDDTKITESAGEFLSLYFLREKVVMEKVRTCSTLIQSMINARLSQQRFWHFESRRL